MSKRKNTKPIGWSEWLAQLGPNLYCHLTDDGYYDAKGNPVKEYTADDLFEPIACDKREREQAYEQWRMTNDKGRLSYDEWDRAWRMSHPVYKDKRTGELWCEYHNGTGLVCCRYEAPGQAQK